MSVTRSSARSRAALAALVLALALGSTAGTATQAALAQTHAAHPSQTHA